MKTLTDKVAVVTGAANGIGRAIAEGLGRAGCRLALVDIDQPGLVAVQESLARDGVHLTIHRGDVSDRVRMSHLVGEVLDAHGAVHLLVNNAGVMVEGLFGDTSMEEWEWVVGTNLWGTVHCCHYFLPHLARADEAHIVIVSGLYGLVGVPGWSAYCATQFALRGLAESLREELRGTNIGLTVVHPSAVNTSFGVSARGHDPELLARVQNYLRRDALSPALVAERTLAGVRAGRARVLVGNDAWLSDIVARALPVAGQDWFARRYARAMGVADMVRRRK